MPFRNGMAAVVVLFFGIVVIGLVSALIVGSHRENSVASGTGPQGPPGQTPTVAVVGQLGIFKFDPTPQSIIVGLQMILFDQSAPVTKRSQSINTAVLQPIFDTASAYGQAVIFHPPATGNPSQILVAANLNLTFAPTTPSTYTIKFAIGYFFADAPSVLIVPFETQHAFAGSRTVSSFSINYSMTAQPGTAAIYFVPLCRSEVTGSLEVYSSQMLLTVV